MNAPETVSNQPAPVESAIRNLRVCRGYMLGCCSALDAAGKSEAVHYLRTSLTSLDDCLDRLERPDAECSCAIAPSGWFVLDYDCPVHGISHEQPTEVTPHHMGDVFHTRETLADDRKMDRLSDADRSDR